MTNIENNLKLYTMKNLFLFTLFFISLTTFGQDKKTITFGIKGGLNASNINGKTIDNRNSNKNGIDLYVGLFAERKLNKKWDIETEIIYSQTMEHRFIEIPLHLKYNFSSKFNILFGPKLDILTTNINRLNKYGFSVEIGTQYKLSKKIFAELRYSHSFTEQIEYPSFLNGKRNTLKLGIGYNF
jgi:opacity protein-like surface antigen